MRIEAIIPAAGLGLRLKTAIPKPLVRIAKKPILVHTLEALSKNKLIDRIIIAVSKENINKFKQALDKYRIKKKIALVLGGPTRKDSVENCLKNISDNSDYVLIHDAVRPFVSKELLGRLLKEAKSSPAVICGVPVKATVKRVCGLAGSRVSGVVEKTVDRTNLWEIQTPQIFRKELLFQAYKKYRSLSVTDDASLVEKLGIKIKVVYGSYFNIKITTAEDLLFAQAILKKWVHS